MSTLRGDTPHVVIQAPLVSLRQQVQGCGNHLSTVVHLSLKDSGGRAYGGLKNKAQEMGSNWETPFIDQDPISSWGWTGISVYLKIWRHLWHYGFLIAVREDEVVWIYLNIIYYRKLNVMSLKCLFCQMVQSVQNYQDIGKTCKHRTQ